MTFSELCNKIFWDCTTHYHTMDNVDATPTIPYKQGTIEFSLFTKNWIDAVQWHLEDIIRDPNINPVDALALKRRIDSSNQDRTDLVEMIDSYFLEKYKDAKPLADATINTESPAWASFHWCWAGRFVRPHICRYAPTVKICYSGNKHWVFLSIWSNTVRKLFLLLYF